MENALKISDVFDKKANTDYFWNFQARSLLRSALILHRQRKKDFSESSNINEGLEILLPELMLWAFTLENSLKALILKNKVKISENGKLTKQIMTHDLVSIANTANFSISSDEKLVLERLSEAGIWEGRYPMPKDSQQRFLGFQWRWPDDKIVMNLVIRIWSSLNWEISGLTI